MHKPLYKIAHITPHVGGGVGSVLKDLFHISSTHSINNSLFCLDRCENNYREFANHYLAFNGMAFNYTNSIYKTLSQYDIIMIHYWNHPLMAHFLINFDLPPCRPIFWCHNSGLYEPHIIPSYIAKIGYKIIFSSSCSMLAPNISSLSSTKINNLDVIHSTRSLQNFLKIGSKKSTHNTDLTILYVGTVSKSKMHQDSAKIMAELSRMGYNITVVGGPDHRIFASEVSSLGGTIQALGPKKNVYEFYKKSDILIYPLRQDHYGTGEQVILEAMACGLPVVTFANPAECSIITDGIDGVLADNCNDFVKKTVLLLNDSNQRKKISQNAIYKISSQFDVNIMINKIIRIFQEVISYDKKTINLSEIKKYKINDIQLYALNSFFDDKILKDIDSEKSKGVDVVFSKIKLELNNPILATKWVSPCKSTPYHYKKYFSQSEEILQLCKLIDNQVKNLNF